MELNIFLDLSHQQQQQLSGGQNLVTTGGSPISPLGRATKDGLELSLGGINVRGTTNSRPPW